MGMCEFERLRLQHVCIEFELEGTVRNGKAGGGRFA